MDDTILVIYEDCDGMPIQSMIVPRRVGKLIKAMEPDMDCEVHYFENQVTIQSNNQEAD